MKLKSSLVIVLISSFFSVNLEAKSGESLLIGGSYYQKIIQVKDVIADVLPPPAYIIESYLISFLVLNEAEKSIADKKNDTKEMQSIETLVEYLRQLKEGVSENAEEEGYFKRVELWSKDLSDSDESLKQLKELMTKTSVVPAKEFFEIFETKFVPAIKARDIASALKYQSELHAAFLRHRIVINQIVEVARKKITSLELLASQNKTKALVKGTLYNEIILLKDLIADVLPPPSFIIESYILDWEMIYGAQRGEKLKAMIGEGAALKKIYLLRHDYWVKNLKIKKIRSLMIEDSYTPALNFYKIHDKDFIPALEKGDVALAKKIMNDQMIPLFEKHRAAIDELVLAADNYAIEIESNIALQLKKH